VISGDLLEEDADVLPGFGAGTVWLNTWHADDVTLPRGGYKESG